MDKVIQDARDQGRMDIDAKLPRAVIGSGTAHGADFISVCPSVGFWSKTKVAGGLVIAQEERTSWMSTLTGSSREPLKRLSGKTKKRVMERPEKAAASPNFTAVNAVAFMSLAMERCSRADANVALQGSSKAPKWKVAHDGINVNGRGEGDGIGVGSQKSVGIEPESQAIGEGVGSVVHFNEAVPDFVILSICVEFRQGNIQERWLTEWVKLGLS